MLPVLSNKLPRIESLSIFSNLNCCLQQGCWQQVALCMEGLRAGGHLKSTRSAIVDNEAWAVEFASQETLYKYGF